MRKKNTQENEDEWWARLDKRIERVRARHEHARPEMGTFLVYVTGSEKTAHFPRKMIFHYKCF